MTYTVLSKEAPWSMTLLQALAAQLGNQVATNPQHPNTIIVAGLHNKDAVGTAMGLTASGEFNLQHIEGQAKLPFKVKI